MSGPEILHAELTSGNPGTLATVRHDLGAAMRSIDDSGDSLALATSGVEWKGEDREAYNMRIWATKALAEMAHLRCSQGKVALRSVAASYDDMVTVVDGVIRTWRKNSRLPLDGPTLVRLRNDTMTALRNAAADYTTRLVAATDYLPTDALAQHGSDWDDYLAGGGLSDAQREALENGLGYSMMFGLDHGTLPGPAVADTEITGNDDEWTPQGVGYGDGTMVQVAYGGPNDDRATASIIDPDTGELLNTVELGSWTETVEGGSTVEHAPHHVGSVVLDGDDVWVTSGDPSATIRYSLQDLRDHRLGDDPVVPRDATRIQSGDQSFSTIHTDRDGTTYLYAGNFGGDRMHRYAKVGSSWVLDPGYEVKTPEFTQGVVVQDDRISFSTSYGQNIESSVETYDRATLEGGGDAARGAGLVSRDWLPNMSEGMVLTPDGLAVMHESGASQYLGNDEQWATPFLTMLQPGDVGLSGDGIEVRPETLRHAARNLRVVSDALESAGRSVRVLHLPSSALGVVEGATEFAKALNLHLDATGIWLQRSEISAGISIDGLVASADHHEHTDRLTLAGRLGLELDRENLDLVGKGKELWQDTQDLGGEVKDKVEEIDVTPWDGLLPG